MQSNIRRYARYLLPLVAIVAKQTGVHRSCGGRRLGLWMDASAVRRWACVGETSPENPTDQPMLSILFDRLLNKIGIDNEEMKNNEVAP